MDTLVLRHPKPTATADRAARKRAMQAKDRAESQKVRERSGGFCEIRIERILYDGLPAKYPCLAKAVHVHHMLSGHGTRGRGESAKAIRKLHLCARHHADIHENRLARVQTGELPVYADVYRRAR